jgi:predicted PurR-regulated permease PerM
VGLHPLVVIGALLIGGALFGVVGMLLAVPVTAVLFILGQRLLVDPAR